MRCGKERNNAFQTQIIRYFEKQLSFQRLFWIHWGRIDYFSTAQQTTYTYNIYIKYIFFYGLFNLVDEKNII